MRSSDVIAVVSTYNNAANLGTLLPDVLNQDYESVYVVDDASTDDTPDVLNDFTGDIKVIVGKENIGPAANRNRVLEHNLGKSALHFIDGDERLVSQRTPELVADALDYKNRGAVGGLITDGKGNMWPGNFVPPISVAYYVGGAIEASVMRRLASSGHNRSARAVRTALYPLLRDFPDLTREPQPRQVFTAIEGNLAIKAPLFEQMRGYDPRLRYHEAQDLAFKIHRAGYINWFDPRIETEHPGMFSMQGRELEIVKATVHLARKYGLMRFLFSV